MENLTWLLDANGKIKVGRWGEAFVDFITTYFQWLFDALTYGLNFVVEGTTAILLMANSIVLACGWCFARLVIHHQSRSLERNHSDFGFGGFGHCSLNGWWCATWHLGGA
jgi:ABC-type proline/glycine betaine transport system permease subunit